MLRQAARWIVDNIDFQIGAGLQITPNASRLLHEWGLQAGVVFYIVITVNNS